MNHGTTTDNGIELNARSTIGLVLVLIASWYSTSSLNAVSTQQFISSRVDQSTPTGFQAMMIVTIFQLLMGAVMASLLLIFVGQGSPFRFKSTKHSPRKWLLVPTLHALGSLFTNMGFTFGSASVVQVIKLLEPLETLLVSRLLSSSTTPISFPVVSSLLLMIAGTVGTLSGWNKPVRKEAVIMATLSGIALATRNSVKKILQQQQQQKTTASPTTAFLAEQPEESSFAAGVREFMKLSLWSATILSGILALVLTIQPVLLPSQDSTGFLGLLESIHQHPKMIVFHGVYNLSSLAVLGYVSALTHSVLNVGKRLVNIVVVTTLFHEQVQVSRVSIGLGIATAGAIWYTLLVKGGGGGDFKPSQRTLMAALAVVSLTVFIYCNQIHVLETMKATQGVIFKQTNLRQ